jgi:hypothetical protein
MVEPELLDYRSLRRMRQQLAESRDIGDYKAFAKSMVSSRDACLMRRLARETTSGEVAAEVFLNLWTMGGIGALTPDITVWLERDDDGSDALVFSGVVLAGMARDLADGTALRALFEFVHHDDIRINRDRLVDKIGRERAMRLLEMSREEQLEDLFERLGDAPSARGLWLLKTYVNIPVVAEYLRHHAALGRLEALVSYFFGDRAIDWSLFNALKPQSVDDWRCVVNLVAENVHRGANVHDFWQTPLGSQMDVERRAEISEEEGNGT